MQNKNFIHIRPFNEGPSCEVDYNLETLFKSSKPFVLFVSDTSLIQRGYLYEDLAHFQLKIQSVPGLILTWSLNLKSSDLIGWNYIIQTGEIKSPRFHIPISGNTVHIWSNVVVAAAGAGKNRRSFFCVKTHLFIAGPLERGGGVDQPSEFYRSVIPISAGKQVFLPFPLDFRFTYSPDSSPFLFDPWKFVTSLSSALINLWRHYLAHWLAVSVTFSQ